MKLIINYDLLDKVNRANGVATLQRIMKNELKFQTTLYGVMTGMDLLSGRSDGVQWGTNFMMCSAWAVARVAIITALERKFKNRLEFVAYLELAKLSIKLCDLSVRTSPELLKESKLFKTEYKLNHESFRPIIQQNKYILVPTYDWQGDIKETSILQEHEMGSEQYILSIGSPSKKFKLAYGYN